MSAGDGAEKRRRPRKQRVPFDDVQGVDEAEEHVEVNNATFLCDAC
jgi:ATP-dependent Zn protease